MELKNKKFYTCKNDRTFKEVFLEEENSDLLKALLETILKIEIEKNSGITAVWNQSSRASAVSLVVKNELIR